MRGERYDLQDARGKFPVTRKIENKEDIFIKCYICNHILWSFPLSN